MKKILLLLILFNGSMAFAQQEAMYTHYMYNIMAVNPAYAGYEKLFTATAIHRSQWISFPGAPRFQTFSIQTPIGKNVGAGLSFVNDQVGPERNIAIKAYYSYTIRAKEKLKISFGLKAGLNVLNIGLQQLDLDNPDDPAFFTNFQSTILPNFGFGVFAYTDNYYFGLSVPDLIEHDYINNTSFSSADLSLNSKKYYLMGGASFEISDQILLKPSAFIGVQFSPSDSTKIAIDADLSSLFIVNNKFAGGLMIRSGNSIAFLFGIMLSDELELGYSYDLLYSNPAANFNGGSHEIVLKYSLENVFGSRTKRSRGRLACPTFQ